MFAAIKSRTFANLNPQGETMLIQNFTFRAAGPGLAAVILLPLQPLRAETSSESDRLEKLERAVEQLQKRNAELEQEVKKLKKETVAVAAVPAEGPAKKQVTYDGKTYVEK